MDEINLDLERARMEREDFRQHNGPAGSLPDSILTVRQHRNLLNEQQEDYFMTLETIGVHARNNQNRPTIRKADADVIRELTAEYY